MKNLTTITLVIATIILGYIAMKPLDIAKPKAGGVSIASFDSFDTSATSTVQNVTTSTPNLAADSNRVYLRICAGDAQNVYWSSTTTNLTSTRGERIEGFGNSTSSQSCVTYPGYKGPVYTIAAATSSVLITEAK